MSYNIWRYELSFQYHRFSPMTYQAPNLNYLAYFIPIVNTIIPIVNAITPIVDFFCNYTDCKRFRCYTDCKQQYTDCKSNYCYTDCKQHHTDCKCYKPHTDNSWISKYEFILRSARRNIRGSAKALGTNSFWWKDDNEWSIERDISE